ncbi:serine protease [Intrasporangium calvum]|uniref:Serine protease n=1 Tax=Intrasporangium calvum TaxID=53358 RepID=A0ABT5GGI2_9MICO|nr:serine protease [Intrasporangium calvum]MDC5697324.1 serine protease [Intrasporangium calvum]
MVRTGLVTAGLVLMVTTAGCAELAPVAPPEARSETVRAVTPTTSVDLEAGEPQLEGFTDLERAALRIRSIGCGGVRTGSGFAIGERVLVTNRHVVAGATTLEVSTFDGTDIDVRTSGAATVADLAIVRTRERLPASITLAPGNPEVGQTVTAVGYPLGGPLTTTDGQVLGYRADPVAKSDLPMLLNSAPVEHGSSGSPLVDISGELVGVVYASTGPGRTYAVPIDVLEDLLEQPEAFASKTDCDD